MEDREIKIEKITLDDGRKAERHTSHDENGNEVVEVFAEEKRPLHLEERRVREFKTIVSKERHEKVKNGEVAEAEVYSLEPDTPLQLRERIGLADHARLVDGDYVRKSEMDHAIANSVVEGVRTLLNQDQVRAYSHNPQTLNAQSIVEKNVSEKNNSNEKTALLIMGVLFVLQIAFFVYVFMF